MAYCNLSAAIPSSCSPQLPNNHWVREWTLSSPFWRHTSAARLWPDTLNMRWNIYSQWIPTNEALTCTGRTKIYVDFTQDRPICGFSTPLDTSQPLCMYIVIRSIVSVWRYWSTLSRPGNINSCQADIAPDLWTANKSDLYCKNPLSFSFAKPVTNRGSS